MHVLNSHETLFVNGGRHLHCVQISPDSCTEISALNTNQEEADTMMILHAKYEADRGATSLVIHSPDTDVMVLLLHHNQNKGALHVFMSTGKVTTHTDCRRLINTSPDNRPEIDN